MLKKIGVFGGTGMTGQCVVNAAVEKGNWISLNTN